MTNHPTWTRLPRCRDRPPNCWTHWTIRRPTCSRSTSRGAESPLTVERHYRRARGRKVEFELSGGERLTGRLGELKDGTAAVVVPVGKTGNYSIREVPLETIAKAIVQVEFSAPSRRELELAGKFEEEAET